MARRTNGTGCACRVAIEDIAKQLNMSTEQAHGIVDPADVGPDWAGRPSVPAEAAARAVRDSRREGEIRDMLKNEHEVAAREWNEARQAEASRVKTETYYTKVREIFNSPEFDDLGGWSSVPRSRRRRKCSVSLPSMRGSLRPSTWRSGCGSIRARAISCSTRGITAPKSRGGWRHEGAPEVAEALA